MHLAFALAPMTNGHNHISTGLALQRGPDAGRGGGAGASTGFMMALKWRSDGGSSTISYPGICPATA